MRGCGQTKPDSMFWVELIEDLRKRRALVLKFALPIVLVLPFTLDSISFSVRLAGLPLIALFLGVLGSSVGLSNLREHGILERLSALPVPRAKMVGGYLAANVTMDALQIALPAAILGSAFAIPMGSAALVAIALLLCLVLANAVGVLMATVAGGSGEVHLYSAVCVLGLAGVSGLFFTAGGTMEAIAGALPFRLLKDGLAGTSLEAGAAHILGSLTVTLIVAVVATVWSSRLFEDRT